MQSSGTVYRLSPGQSEDLQNTGMPVALLSLMQMTYEHAVRQNPDLGKSDAQWTQIDGYWYGGLPFGWPREWVFGAPSVGELLH